MSSQACLRASALSRMNSAGSLLPSPPMRVTVMLPSAALAGSSLRHSTTVVLPSVPAKLRAQPVGRVRARISPLPPGRTSVLPVSAAAAPETVNAASSASAAPRTIIFIRLSSQPASAAGTTKLSITRFSPECSKAMVSLSVSTLRTSP